MVVLAVSEPVPQRSVLAVLEVQLVVQSALVAQVLAFSFSLFSPVVFPKSLQVAKSILDGMFPRVLITWP